MAKYKVLKGEVGGFGGKTFAKDSICSDSDFPAGNAQDLEKMGYLQLIADTDAETDSDVEETETETETEETETETEETETEETEETADTDAETDSDSEEKPLSIRSMNKSDIIQILVMKGIEFAENMNKEELYELYVKNF
jgi:uncharacterized Zn finger protein